MTNYTKTTDFAAKDSLPSGDSGKIIRGSEFETEFDNIATAVNSKSDANNPTFTGTVTIDGLTVNGNTVLGNAATDTVTVTADIASNLLPSADDTYNLGASGAEWNDLFIDGTANIDSLVADTADINGGTIDGVTIGGSSAGAITGTTITGASFVTSGNMTFGDNDKAQFGAGPDLQIYHDGSDSYIKDIGTGSLKLAGADVEITTVAGIKYFSGSSGVSTLYHTDAAKLATTSTGIDVTGTASVDALDVNGAAKLNSNSAEGLQLGGDASGSTLIGNLKNTSGRLTLQSTTSRNVAIQTNGATDRILVSSGGDVSFYEDTGTTAKFFWDASAERLGIGTSSPSYILDLQNATGGVLARFKDSDSSYNGIVIAGDTAAGWVGNNSLTAGEGIYYQNSLNAMRMYTNGTERMRIDSSGNLLVGKTSTGAVNVGVELNSSGYVTASVDGGEAAFLNRKTSDGSIVQFRKDNSAVGSIGTASSDMYIGTGVANLRFFDSLPSIVPATSSGASSDNAIDLGHSGGRFKDLYLSNAVYAGNAGLSSGDLFVAIDGDADGISTGYKIRTGVDSTSSASHLAFVNPNGIVGTIKTNGSATSFNTSSDYRLKENVVAMSGATERLKQLSPKRFNFIADADVTVDGFLAHEVQSVVPEAITGAKDAMRDEEYEVTPAVLDDDGNVVTEAVMGTRSVPDYQGIDHSKLVPLLVATIQELEARIAALESN